MTIEVVGHYNKEVQPTYLDTIREDMRAEFEGSRTVIMIAEEDAEGVTRSVISTGDIHEPIYLASVSKQQIAAGVLHYAEVNNIPLTQEIPMDEKTINGLQEELAGFGIQLQTPVTLENAIHYMLGPSSNEMVVIMKNWVGTDSSNYLQEYVETALDAGLHGTSIEEAEGRREVDMAADTMISIRGSDKAIANGSPNIATPLELFTLSRMIAKRDERLQLSDEAVELLHAAMRSGHGDVLLEFSARLKGMKGIEQVTDKSGTYPDFELRESKKNLGLLYGLNKSPTYSRSMHLSSFATIEYEDGRKRYVFYHVGVPYIMDKHNVNVQQVDLETVVADKVVGALANVLRE